MKAFSPSLILPVLSLALCCSAVELSPSSAQSTRPSTGIEVGPNQPVPVFLPVTPIADTLKRLGPDEVVVLLRTPKDYAQYFGHASPKNINWSKEWVLFYSGGLQPWGGNHAAIQSVQVTEAGQALLVSTMLITAGPDCGIVPGPEIPYMLAKIPKPATDILIVRSHRDYGHMLCGG